MGIRSAHIHSPAVKETTMPNQVVRLIFPPHLLDEPVINQLIRRYNLTVNILRANITAEEGWMDLQLTGSAAVIENATTWLKGRGVEVQGLAQ
jgi:ABC-type methionine transport system ATPase subunit